MPAKRKSGLGRGLDSLFEDTTGLVTSDADQVQTLPLREIEPDRDQPRKVFEENALAQLVREHRPARNAAAHCGAGPIQRAATRSLP